MYPDLLLFITGRPECRESPLSLLPNTVCRAPKESLSSLLCRDERLWPPRLPFIPVAEKFPAVGSRKFFCDDRLEMFPDAVVTKKFGVSPLSISLNVLAPEWLLVCRIKGEVLSIDNPGERSSGF